MATKIATQTKPQKKEGGIGLFKYLTFAPEAREDGGVSKPVEGRFRHFGKTFSTHNGQLMLCNLLFIVTLLPLLAVLIVMSIYGTENLSNRINGITDLPYFLTGVGIGISQGSDVMIAKIQILSVHSWAFLFSGIGVVIASIGIAGMMHLSVKFIWEDSFVCKKDSYGNDTPRAIVEFFRGIKKYWWQTLIVGLMAGILVAGVGNAYTFFISRLWEGVAGAGEWILIIFVSLIAVIGVPFLLILLPTIVMYDISFGDKMKNAMIITLQMPLQNLLLLVAFVAPFVVAAVTSGFVHIILIAVLLVFGAPFYCLLTANYVQYYAEKIITPVYSAKTQKAKKPKKAKNK